MIDGGRPTMIDGGRPTMIDGGRPTMIDGGRPTMIDGGRPTMIDGGRPTIIGGGRPTMIDGGRPTMIDGGRPTMIDGGRPTMIDGGRPTMIDGGRPTMIDGGRPTMIDGGRPTMIDAGRPTMINEGRPTVPQGSILGPFLLLIHINDRTTCIQEGSVRLYADDRVIYLRAKTPEVAIAKLQPELSRVSEWCRLIKLSINTAKTKRQFFSRKKVSSVGAPGLILDGKKLCTVETYKYLGIMLDNHLNVVPHPHYITKIVAHKIFLLGKIRNLINTRAAIKIYKSKVLPYMDYGDIFYHG